jgi:hypothetical protein
MPRTIAEKRLPGESADCNSPVQTRHISMKHATDYDRRAIALQQARMMPS